MKLVTKSRGIKGYKSISEERLFSSLNELDQKIRNQKRIEMKTLSIKEYLNMIRPYLRDIINDCKTQGERKKLFK